ncbi:hypothetical protein F7R12_19965 [Pseudomonas tolaasii]|nr:hypothetical protein F7R12_19965 [Pseudomonas tolaasii]
MWELACVGAGLARDAGTAVFNQTESMLSPASQLPHEQAPTADPVATQSIPITRTSPCAHSPP